MNQFVPDWSNMGDTPRPLGEDDDLIELLWCNGHVVMQSQSHRKAPVPPRPDKAQQAAAAAPPPAPPPAPSPVPQEDEGGLWFPFALADSLDKDLFSDFFCDAPPAAVATPVAASAGAGAEASGKPCREVPAPVPAEQEEDDEDRRVACPPPVSGDPCDLMPPPKSTPTPASCSRQQTMSLDTGGGGDNDCRVLLRAAKSVEAGGGASSMLSAIGSSICGSNQVLVQRAVGAPGRGGASASGSGTGTGTARGGSGFTTTTTTEPTSGSNRSSKRKRLDTEESESPSEDAESESAAMLARKPPQKMTAARRSRAAEVHNLSERRRRDRINEKMRALQDLIPHCNKTDKASMLDEAIEYLKSLQLQVQMMWMGSGIAAPPAVMFPGVHQYLPRMGVGMGAAAAALPRLPFMAPQPVVPSPQVNVNPAVHMPAAVGITAEPYGHYLGVNHLQPPPPPSQHYAQGVGYYPPPPPPAALGAKAVPVQQQQQQQQTPEFHHVPPGPGAGMPLPAGVLPPESATAPGRGPG